MLADMQLAIFQKEKNVLPSIDEAAERIQRAAKLFIKRKNFRTNLYKLIIFKNIVENKIHKEKMSMLYSFE